MICPRCRAENGPGTRFCGHCSAPLSAACSACGAVNPPDNRFCGQCAAPLAATVPAAGGSTATPSPSGEFRQVTVLFCDLVNSTGLAERLGDETLHELLRRFLDVGIAEVRRYDGSVPQFTGDGFMALFGAPVAHEDHVRRALLAAMAILRSVDGGPEAETAAQAPDLAIRIGVNTGLVVFGAVAGDLRMDATAIGDTANVAARLQAEAEPNSIVISDATFRLAGGYARAEPIGALRLKGKQEPVSAFRLIEVRSRPPAITEREPFGSRLFVGREREIAVLDELLDRAEQGGGQAVGVQGEPGIGKSRLMAELNRLAAGRCSWIEGHCLSYGTAIPYLLALDLLRSGCGILDRDRPAEIIDKVREGLRAVGMDPDADGPLLLALLGIGDAAEAAQNGNVPAVKARAFAILRQFAINTSRDRLLVLALEDLHWVDKVSEEFLDFLAESLPGARILLLATYRPGYRPAWIGKSYATQIALQPLTHEDSRQVLRSVLERKGLSDRLAGTILARAEGNPLFLEQLALHVGEETDAAGQSVPATIRDVVMARIDRLPVPTRRLLQIAAVAGREFPLRLLREVWQGPEPLAPLLRELLQLEFLYERIDPQETSYVFRHALTQDAAYTGLLARDRRRAHAAVGAALETLYPGRAEEVAELLALHYERSDDDDKAVDHAILAAEKAQRRWANAEALSYFETALRRLDSRPDTKPNRLRRIDAVIKQVEVKLALGRHAEHATALAGIRDIVEDIDDPRRRAGWHYWMGFLGCLTGGLPSIAIEHCREAAAIAATAGFDELDGHIQSCLAQAYTVAGELRAALDAGERAVSIFETRGNRWYASRALWHLSTAANYLGQWDASLAYCCRAYEHGIALDDIRLKGIALWRRGSAHIQRGDIEEGLRYCEEALALNSNPYDTATTRLIRGYGLVKAGHFDRAIAELVDVAAWFERSNLTYTRSQALLWLSEAHVAQRDHASARAILDRVLPICRTNGYRHYEALAYRLVGECVAATEPAAAGVEFDRALRAFDRLGMRNDVAKALLSKALLQRDLADTAGARQLLRRALAKFEALGTRDETIRARTALVELDRRCGNEHAVVTDLAHPLTACPVLVKR